MLGGWLLVYSDAPEIDVGGDISRGNRRKGLRGAGEFESANLIAEVKPR
jgi:hypothetical protein